MTGELFVEFKEDKREYRSNENIHFFTPDFDFHENKVVHLYSG